MDRRSLLVTGGAVAAAGVLGACSSPQGESSPTASGSTVGAQGQVGQGQFAATVGEIPVGGGLIYDEPAIVITQPQEGVIKAFSAICTHQGCIVGEVADNVITCPCHGAQYSAESGEVLRGPAPKPLPEAPVVIDGDTVIIG